LQAEDAGGEGNVEHHRQDPDKLECTAIPVRGVSRAEVTLAEERVPEWLQIELNVLDEPDSRPEELNKSTLIPHK
jgi:hypothetical protein